MIHNARRMHCYGNRSLSPFGPGELNSSLATLQEENSPKSENLYCLAVFFISACRISLVGYTLLVQTAKAPTSMNWIS